MLNYAFVHPFARSEAVVAEEAVEAPMCRHCDPHSDDTPAEGDGENVGAEKSAYDKACRCHLHCKMHIACRIEHRWQRT